MSDRPQHEHESGLPNVSDKYAENSSPGYTNAEDSQCDDDVESDSSKNDTDNQSQTKPDLRRPPLPDRANLLLPDRANLPPDSVDGSPQGAPPNTTDHNNKRIGHPYINVEKDSPKLDWNIIYLLATLVCVVLAVFAMYIGPANFASFMSTDKNLPHSSTGPIPQFTKAFQNIKGAFPKQSVEFWTVLGAGTKSIISRENPERPAVFLVVVPSDASDTADCLLRNFSATITDLFKARRPVEFTPQNVDELTPEEIKHRLDDTLKDGLSSGSRVAVVHHLENLPGESAGMLHAFCDDSNAPHRDVVYVLTLHVDESTSSVTESDMFVRDRLKTLWGDQMGTNRFDPLLSRIAGSIAFVRPENSDILRQNMC